MKEEDQKLPEAEWTAEQWRTITKDWSGFSRLLTKLARKRNYEERRDAGGDLFESRGGFDPAYLKFISDIWSLPDEVLDRIISSFE